MMRYSPISNLMSMDHQRKRTTKRERQREAQIKQIRGDFINYF
jgi:hypothetical protein